MGQQVWRRSLEIQSEADIERQALFWAISGSGLIQDDWSIASGVEFEGVWETIRSRSTSSPARPISALYAIAFTAEGFNATTERLRYDRLQMTAHFLRSI